MKILIKNGRVIDPATNFDEVCDVAIAAGRIIGIGKLPAEFSPNKVMDAWILAGRQRFGSARLFGRVDGVKTIVAA